MSINSSTVKRLDGTVMMSIDGGEYVEAIDCPDCFGWGEVDVEYPRPQSFDRDIGVIDVVKGECERCSGIGAIQKEDESDE